MSRVLLTGMTRDLIGQVRLCAMPSQIQMTRAYRNHPGLDPQTKYRKRMKYMHAKQSSDKYSAPGVSVKQYPVKVEWERPIHVTRVTPGEDGSGDMEGLPEVDPARPLALLEDSEDYKNASPDVKRILSIEFARNSDIVKVIHNDVVRSVQRHPLDFTSLEVIIAQLTVRIRRAQADIERLKDTDSNLRHRTKIQIDHRRALLRRLREKDIRKFEWLLEKLNIVYKPRPAFWERIERKKHMARLTDLWCQEYKEHLLSQLKSDNLSKQPEFLREKAKSIEWIAKEERDLGLEISVDVKEADKLRKLADELEQKLEDKVGQDDDADKYFIYQPEAPSTEKQLLK